ncbi:MAG TPA: FG-GAP-like repeat-containing protein [Pirellulales bacterium]|jgi:dienelactone hydrolase|nr:FG-GAP-like repeat-containing protein [Pirellulales bacterium]
MKAFAWIALVTLVAASIAAAGEPSFVRHDVDLEATLSAASAMDVNHDGRLDIVTGAAWYEAPTWKKHKVRDVEFIRGRYEDYANLPIDVNGDGWQDFLIANYRSEKVAWVENPGTAGGAWTEHVIERPGNSETGRLFDIDGDGQGDLLPNGKNFAAWWEFKRGSGSISADGVRWTRHDLPEELQGHGIGFGDVNGDGRGDVVGANGWAEAPVDRRAGRWTWHAEFKLDKGASVPIVVMDVDGDGDSDLVWGRGHRTGLWWSEQELGDDKTRSWQNHAIDTSWAQPHTVEAADIDGDGNLEIVTGKRYLAHDGNDPGEWDVLCLYWYKFEPSTKTFLRHVISERGNGSFDVDPKIVDLDGDGDLDILAPGRSGLCWFKNMLRTSSSSDAQPSPLALAPAYADHKHLLVVRDEQGHERPVSTPRDWGLRRTQILSAMQMVMGPLPGSSVRAPLDVRADGDDVDCGKYLRRKLTYAAEPGDRVSAYLLVPKKLSKPAAAMLCLHQTNSVGKEEPVGLAGKPNMRYAAELAERGYVCLVPDYPTFGDLKDYDFHSSPSAATSGTMKAIWNNIRAIDLLQTMPEVDLEKIGCIGHSLGGHNALFTAAFDLRIQVVVSSCGFTGLHDYYGGKLKGWAQDRYMPRVREVYHENPDEMPFDFHEVLAALAPRPVFVNAPTEDSNFAVAGVRDVMASAGEVYKFLGANEQLAAAYPDAAHDFPDSQRERAYAWLDRWLKKSKK